MAVKLLSNEDTLIVKDSELIDGGDTKTSYTIRHMDPDKIDEIYARHTRKANFRRPEKINQKEVDKDMIDYALVAWTGVEDAGRPVPCEREYKLRLDRIRRNEILQRAGVAEVVDGEAAEERAESFRKT